MAGTSKDDLAARVHRVIDDNVYMVLGTADADGRPATAPVFFAADGARDFYWISSPDVTHSVNLARRPEVSIVLFDSRAPVGTGGESAVYMVGTAGQVPDDEIEQGLAFYPGPPERGARARTVAELQPPALYRLYRARVAEHFVLCPLEGGGVPCAEHGKAYDHRTRVELL
jgi:nitroimidazol reductase NimA-like FMN-containing flavoprotein (pyridoxamine 5'-phosphate oxidase superfamily)